MNMPAVSETGQGSVEWLYERVGHITASRFKDVMATKKDGSPTAALEAYIWEVVIERLTGKPTEHYTSVAMGWGVDQEPFSRMAFESHTGQIVTECGFIKHPTIPMVGGSPDGLIDDDGIWESKSPYNSANHLQTWLTGMPEEHIAQVQGLLAITGRQYCVFQSFDPRMPKPLDVYMQRVERDDAYIERLEAKIITALAEVDNRVRQLRERGEGA